jgi:hypothetical protein
MWTPVGALSSEQLFLMEFVAFSPAIASSWDELVGHSDDGWMYALSRWQQLLVQIPIWDFEDRSFAVHDGGRLVAVMPLQLMRDGRLCSTAMGPSGPVVANELSDADRSRILEALFKEVHRIAEQSDASTIEVFLSPLSQAQLKNAPKANPLTGFGLKDVSTHTWMLDLSPNPEALTRGLSENARRKIKEARGLGYTIREIKSREEMDVYYEVHSETYHRTGVHPHPKEYFLGIYDGFTRAGFSKILVAENASGRTVGFFNVAIYKRKALYWTSCCRDEDYRNGVYYLLMWSAIEAARADGCDIFECGEAFPDAAPGSKERGLSDFKRKFGGRLEPFFKGKIVLKTPSAPPLGKRIHNALGAAKRALTPLLGERMTGSLSRAARVLGIIKDGNGPGK